MEHICTATIARFHPQLLVYTQGPGPWVLTEFPRKLLFVSNEVKQSTIYFAAAIRLLTCLGYMPTIHTTWRLRLRLGKLLIYRATDKPSKP